MSAGLLLSEITSEIALFAAVGGLLFALDDLAVDLIYFARSGWRSLTVYTRYPRAFAAALAAPERPGRLAVLVPAWDEAAVIGDMLRATLARFEHDDYRLYVGYYRNDPATAAAIAAVIDRRVRAVELAADGPTTKADCLNHLYTALGRDEAAGAPRAKAIVLHDAEDLVHPLELRLFDRLVERASVVQLPVLPVPDPQSRWIAGHYADEFAQSHIKELVVREAVGAAIPLAGVGCAIERGAIDRLAAAHGGKPFAGGSLTEDYELGLRLGALGFKTMFVRLPARLGSRAVVASRGHFPADLNAAVRQKARWGSDPATPQRAQSTPAELIRTIPGIDRLSMSAWAMMRGDAGSDSLATNGQLGGSQAGTRFLWRFDRRFAASLRSSAPVGGTERSAEIVAGLRWQPFIRVPAALTVERRQSFGPDKGRSAFALFAEGGVYDRPTVAAFNLDAYLQTGVVGVSEPDFFVDGSATLTRPVWRRFSAGFGLWGGAQPGLARLDAGPRASLRIGRSMRIHLDYRHRLVGQAEPGSGPVVTLAGDF